MVGFSTVICVVGILIFVFCWTMIAIKFFKSRHSSVMSVRATVVDKYIHKPVSRMPGAFAPQSYMIVFMVGNKKLQFAVSEYSYNNYKVKDVGILKYQGNSLIDFK